MAHFKFVLYRVVLVSLVLEVHALSQDRIEWISYLGGTYNDDHTAVAVDAGGNVYVVGATISTDFPTTAEAIRRDARPSASRRNPSYLGFLAKLDTTGRRLIYGTYIGGSVREGAAAVAVDPMGNVWVGGSTDSPDFPVTQEAPQKKFAGPSRIRFQRPGDGFLMGLDPQGRLRFSTYLGGNGSESVSAVAVDQRGHVYAAGTTDSENFLGAAKDLAKPSGSVDAFIVQLDTRTGEVGYVIRIGGSGNISVAAIAVNAAEEVFVGGSTDASDLLVTEAAAKKTHAGSTDAFLVKLDTRGKVQYLTYWGGKNNEIVKGLGLNTHGAAYLAGWTNSEDFPTTGSAYQSAFAGGSSDGFIVKIDPRGNVRYSTFLGGGGFEDIEGIAVDRLGRAHLAGRVSATSDMPVTEGFSPPAPGASQHAFYARLDMEGRRLERCLRIAGSGRSGHEIFRVTKDGRVALDPAGNAYVTANTTDDVSATSRAYQRRTAGGHETLILKIGVSR